MARTGWHEANRLEDGRIVEDGKAELVIEPEVNGDAIMVRVYFLRDNGGPLEAIEIPISMLRAVLLATNLFDEVAP